MELFATPNSPYARMPRIVVLEKGLGDRVTVVHARTRERDSPYYQINPSGRVPYLITDDGLGLEDSTLICAYLDQSDGQPILGRPDDETSLQSRRLEALAHSLLAGLAVWTREGYRPENEQSPTIVAQSRMQTAGGSHVPLPVSPTEPNDRPREIYGVLLAKVELDLKWANPLLGYISRRPPR